MAWCAASDPYGILIMPLPWAVTPTANYFSDLNIFFSSCFLSIFVFAFPFFSCSSLYLYYNEYIFLISSNILNIMWIILSFFRKDTYADTNQQKSERIKNPW